MECIVENNTDSIKKSINNLSIIELLHEVNKDLFNTFELNSSEPACLKATFNDTGNIPISHFYIDLIVNKPIHEPGLITITLKNNNSQINNIQFELFNIYIKDIADGKLLFKIDYKINKTLYARIILRTLDRIIHSIIMRLISFINNIPPNESI